MLLSALIGAKGSFIYQTGIVLMQKARMEDRTMLNKLIVALLRYKIHRNPEW